MTTGGASLPSNSQELEYSLGTWSRKPDGSGLDFHLETPLTRPEFEELASAASAYRSLVERPTYEALHRSHHRITSMLDMYANLEKVGGSFRNIDQRFLISLFMGELVSWLAASRLYVETARDFTETNFGDPSEELGRVKQALSQAFDTYEGYRFLYDLRNYSQHCGPPLSGVMVFGDEQGNTKIDMYLEKSSMLAANFSWSRHVRVLFERWPERIFLRPLLKEAMTGLREVEDELLRIAVVRCRTVRTPLEAALSRIEGAGNPAVFGIPPQAADTDLQDDAPVKSSDLKVATLPPAGILTAVDLALAAPDPLTALRAEGRSPQRPVFSAEQNRANARAAAMISTFREFGGEGPEIADAINRIIQEDGSISPLISGLVNISAVMLHMASEALGSSPQSLLGNFSEEEDQ